MLSLLLGCLGLAACGGDSGGQDAGVPITVVSASPATSPAAATPGALASSSPRPAGSSSPSASPSGAASSDAKGSITGRVAYPSDGPSPAMKVYAFSTSGGDRPAYWWTHLNAGQGASFTIVDVPAGTYHVFAYVDPDVGDLAGGYTQAVPCGLKAACADHGLLAVVVRPGQVVSGADVSDWFAPPSSFPGRPTYFG